MTATAEITNVQTEPLAGLRTLRRRFATESAADLLAFSGCMGTLLVLYLLLQNPYWVPGGDSEVYTAIARNLLQGEGHTFNGQPVSMVPPGWSWALAAAMKISPEFRFLKLVTMSCMLGSLAMTYWICRRFASPVVSAMVVLLSGILSHIYSLTFWLHSDALFCLFSTAAVLLAFQLNEGRSQAWRWALLIILCSASVFVRWAGVFTWLVVAAVLLHGEFWPRWNRRWIAVAVTFVVTVGTFVSIRAALSVPPDIQRKIRDAGGAEGDVGVAANQQNIEVVSTIYRIFNPASGGWTGYVARATRWGNWIAYLLWQPLRIGAASAAIGAVSLLVGWIALLLLLLAGIWSIRGRQWIWLSLLMYSFALAMNWPHPNARYLVPIAPLIILGVLKGVDVLRERYPSPIFGKTANVVLGYFVASILLVNLSLYAVDVRVAHAQDFYDSYDAGVHRDLLSAVAWLNQQQDLADGHIAVCERYTNMGRTRTSRLGVRAMAMLTDRAVGSVPWKYLRRGDPRRSPAFLNWARSINVRYVLYQPEVSPWRVFHFRLGWLQEIMTGQAALDTGAGWRLYEIPAVGEEALRVSLDPADQLPTRVPRL
jgi:hypothetical protein